MDAPVPFHPVIESWFRSSFGRPTDVQNQAWSRIRAGLHTLIAAPTGSGKTLAALLPCLDRIIRSKEDGDVLPGVRLLYVTPLKALNNDIHHHLFRFAAEMSGTAKEHGLDWPGFSIGIRTGDTSQSTRASMLRQPTDLLVTTPESLYLMLTSLKGREILRTVRQVVVDEIHDLAADKRGVHLSLTLERLAAWCGGNPQRIGVSATQKPLERVACFLGGWEEDGQEGPERPLRPRPVAIVESAMEKRFEVQVTMPDRGVRALDRDAVWTPLVERLLQKMEGSRSVLIFVNNRRLCERLTLRLNDYTGYEMARSHHGSVSREKRLEVEGLLKSGALRCLVATSTLELGIDVGHVDLVIQVDSPKQAAAGIQRIGRAGHAVGGASRGVIVARGRGDLAETAVLAKAIAARDIEDIRIPRHCLDVLSQQTVAAVAADDWKPEELYRLFMGSDCFHGFPQDRFRAMLDVLSGFYPFSKPLIGWDRDGGRLYKLASTSMAASMGAGTIPQTSAFPVHHVESRVHIGELDEEYVYESRVGDVFQLGTSSWVIRSIRQDRIYVAEGGNGFSEIPFWRAEAGGRSPELGRRIGRLLDEIRLARGSEEASEHMRRRLMEEYRLEEEAADELMAYVGSQASVSAVPTDTLLVAEHYKDDASGHHLIIHCLCGRRINRTWELALRARFDALCSLPVYSAAKDDGIEFVFPEWDPAWLTEPMRLLPEQVERLIRDMLPGTSMLGKAFREIAETSLLLTKGYVRQSSWKKRYRSEELLKEALPYADRFPFLREAYGAVLEESLDIGGLMEVLQGLQEGRILMFTSESAAPSPFAIRFTGEYIMTALYESDALGRDVQLRLLNVDRSLAADWFGAEGIRSLISPKVLQAVKERLEQPEWLRRPEAGPAEALRLLKEQGDCTEAEAGSALGAPAAPLLRELEAAGSACRIELAGDVRWIARDEKEVYSRFPESEESLVFVLKRHIERRLSFRTAEIAARYGLEPDEAGRLMERWLEEGFVERAPFAEAGENDLFTASKVAERIVRFSVQDFRLRYEAVSPERYAAHLLALHHLHPQYGLEGEEGLLEAVGQLQGLFLPLSFWEGHLFPARVEGYRKELLDRLCASGEIFWMGRKGEGEKEGKIAFFLTAAKESSYPFMRAAEQGASAQPELLELLRRKGATFLSALARETGELPSELLPRLMDLVWEGRVSNDQFSPLRTPTAAKGKTSRAAGFQSGLGRWYALMPEAGGPDGIEAAALGFCKHWIGQFGVLTRHSSAPGSPYPWELLSEMLKRLEDWGMVTRGFFVEGIPAMQFSTREQVELLHTAPLLPEGRPVLVSASDPANPYGAWLDWPELPGIPFSRKPGNFLVYDGVHWVLWIENYGKSIAVLPGSGHGPEETGGSGRLTVLLRESLRILLSRYHLRKIAVDRWNGRKAAEPEAGETLMSIGGEKDREGYVFWPSSLKG